MKSVDTGTRPMSSQPKVRRRSRLYEKLLQLQIHTLPLRFLFHLETLYLFTASDFVSIIFPQTLFALFSVLSGPALTTNPSTQLFITLTRLPYTLLWVWLNLFILCVGNQRLPSSVAEDVQNKPWRPLPMHRLTPAQARGVQILSIPTVYLVSVLYTGAERETLLLFTLNWIYNDLDAANDHHLLRNVMNALGYTAFGAGATRVMCDSGFSLNGTKAPQWLLLIALVLFSTIHAQDLYDQQGDAARGRSTTPLVLGDARARWTIAVPVLCWSVATPTFWRLAWWAYCLPLGLGCLVAVRVLSVRSVQGDRTTFKCWAVWIISIYVLPLVSNPEVLLRQESGSK